MLCISRTWCNPSYKLLAFGLHHLHISIFLVLLYYFGLSYAINDDDDDDSLRIAVGLLLTFTYNDQETIQRNRRSESDPKTISLSPVKKNSPDLHQSQELQVGLSLDKSA